MAFLKNEQQQQFVLATVLPESNILIYDGVKAAFEMPVSAFKEVFTGVIVAIDKNDAARRFSLQKNKKQIVAGIVTASLGALFILREPAIPTILYFILGIVGILFSILLVQKQNGTHSGLLDKFCTAFANTDCDTVLHAKSANLSKWLSLTDIGIIYFSVQLLGTVFLSSAVHVFFAVSAIASLFSLYSVWQQAFVIKKWCLLCIGVISVLMLQGILGLLFLRLTDIAIIEIVPPLYLLLAGLSFWLLIKPVLGISASLHRAETGLLAFKRSRELFLPVYKSLEQVEDALLKKVPEIIIGNAHAPVTITIVTNPMCSTCRHAHEQLAGVLHTYQESVCMKVVFYVPYKDEKDARTMIAGWLYYMYVLDRNKGTALINGWYKQQDMQAFHEFMKLKQDMSLQYDWLAIHRQWCIQNKATMTPMLFVNRKLFPLIYEVEDLRYHISQIIEEEQNKEVMVKRNSSIPNMVLVNNT